MIRLARRDGPRLNLYSTVRDRGHPQWEAAWLAQLAQAGSTDEHVHECRLKNVQYVTEMLHGLPRAAAAGDSTSGAGGTQSTAVRAPLQARSRIRTINGYSEQLAPQCGIIASPFRAALR